MSTNTLKASEIKRSWHLVDAKGKILGRLATEVATKLMGKHKPNFVPYMDNGDNVVVVNADKIKVTGKKESQKAYFRHSGYPSGDKSETLGQLRRDHPARLVEHAVKGMLPHNRLGRKMVIKLHVFAGSENPLKEKFKKEEKPDAAE